MRPALVAFGIALAGSFAGCVAAPMQPAPESAAAKTGGEPAEPPPRGAVYHPRGADGYGGIGVVPYAGNRLGDDPYTSEQDFY